MAKDFPGDPVVKTPRFHYKGAGLISGQGSYPHQKKKKNNSGEAAMKLSSIKSLMIYHIIDNSEGFCVYLVKPRIEARRIFHSALAMPMEMLL